MENKFLGLYSVYNEHVGTMYIHEYLQQYCILYSMILAKETSIELLNTEKGKKREKKGAYKVFGVPGIRRIPGILKFISQSLTK